MGKKGTPPSGTPGKIRPFQKAAHGTGRKADAAVPCLDAEVKGNNPSQENDVRQRSLTYTIRILRLFFLFIFCDTNAEIKREQAKNITLSEDRLS